MDGTPGPAAWWRHVCHVLSKLFHDEPLSACGPATATSNYVALYGRFTNSSNYYAVAWQGNGTVAYRHRANGGGSDTYNQDTLLTIGQWYTLGLELSGTRTRTFVDGTLISEAIGTAAPSGQIALGVYGATARFDDVRVTMLP